MDKFTLHPFGLPKLLPEEWADAADIDRQFIDRIRLKLESQMYPAEAEGVKSDLIVIPRMGDVIRELGGVAPDPHKVCPKCGLIEDSSSMTLPPLPPPPRERPRPARLNPAPTVEVEPPFPFPVTVTHWDADGTPWGPSPLVGMIRAFRIKEALQGRST